MRRWHCETLLLCALCAIAAPAAAQIMVDDFEQNNGNWNSLGYWASTTYEAGPGSYANMLWDWLDIQKNGSRGGAFFYSNSVVETTQPTLYEVVSSGSPYLNLSTNTWHIRFWVKAYEGKPKIDKVRLEGNDPFTEYAQADFEDYNDGREEVAWDWREISIPVSNLLADVSAQFSLQQVHVVKLVFGSDSTNGFSTVHLDDIQIHTNPAPFLGAIATNSFMVDDFEQNNGKANTLGFWSDVYADTWNGSDGGLVADDIAAGRDLSGGGTLYYSNSVSESTASKYYTTLHPDCPYLCLTQKDFHVRFWIKWREGTPAIDRVILEGSSPSTFGRVAFSNYNRGASAVPKDWYEISIPVADFAGDTGGGFTPASVKLLAFSFLPGSSTGWYSRVYLDEVQIATNAATPATGVPVTNTLVVDDFEQNNGKTNTLGIWTDVWCDTNHTASGLIADFADAKHLGSYGGLMYVSNRPTASQSALFYSVLNTNWPYADLSHERLAVEFWIKRAEGTAAINRVVLQGVSDQYYGAVDFAPYNGGSGVVSSEWVHISIPATNFLADTGGGFELGRVKLVGFEVDPTSGRDATASLWLDEVQITLLPEGVDLAVTKIPCADPYVTGSLSYAVTVMNAGSQAALSVVVTDVLPAEVTFDAGSSDPSCAEAGGIVTWSMPSLSAGSATQFTIGVTVNPGTIGLITNRVSVNSSVTDMNAADNAAAAIVEVRDTDTDGTADFEDPDDDGDGILDYWEIRYFNGPTNASPGADDDGDGDDNETEWIADTNPGNSNSYFRIGGFTLASPPSVAFTSSSARVYDVYYLTNIPDGVWCDLVTNRQGNDSILSVPDPEDALRRAYRIRVRIP